MAKLAPPVMLSTVLIVTGCGESATQPAQSPEVTPAADEGADAEAPTEAELLSADDGDPSAEGGETSDEGSPSGDDKDVGVSQQSSRSADVLRPLVDAKQAPVQQCYQKVLKQKPKLRGLLMVFVLIDPEGAVKEARVDDKLSKLKDAEVAQCAVDFIKDFKFPASPKGMETEYYHPFKFKP